MNSKRKTKTEGYGCLMHHGADDEYDMATSFVALMIRYASALQGLGNLFSACRFVLRKAKGLTSGRNPVAHDVLTNCWISGACQKRGVFHRKLQ